MKRDDDGFLVTVESLDGAGGSTVCLNLHAELDCYRTDEPSDLWTGRVLDRCLDESNDTHPLPDMHYYLADRVHHIEQEVRPELEDGRLVVSDRWSDSTRAYQPVLLEDEFATREEARSHIRECLRPIAFRPDLTLWIDTEPEECIERIDEPDKHERLELLQEVREEYKHLERTHSRFKRVDGNRDIDDIVEGCLNIIDIYRNA